MIWRAGTGSAANGSEGGALLGAQWADPGCAPLLPVSPGPLLTKLADALFYALAAILALFGLETTHYL